MHVELSHVLRRVGIDGVQGDAQHGVGAVGNSVWVTTPHVREQEHIQATRRSAWLDAGFRHAVVLRRDGGVACWGLHVQPPKVPQVKVAVP